MADAPEIKKHTIAVLVENRFGVLSRVAGLFSGPKSCTWGSRICPQLASFPTTATMGSLNRSAVS